MVAWGVPKEPLEGFGAFEGWQRGGLNASKKLLMSPGRPRKAIDMALVPWRAGTGVPKKVLEGFGGFHGWQTAGLNASKKLLMSPGRPRKAIDMALVPWRASGAKKGFRWFWSVSRLGNGRRQ